LSIRSDVERPLAEEVASWVALAIGHADLAAWTVEELAHRQTAMKSRAVIEQAKGVPVERGRITEEMAFTMQSRASQNSNLELREVVSQLVTTGHSRSRPTWPSSCSGARIPHSVELWSGCRPSRDARKRWEDTLSSAIRPI
jgi:hypothetical protein